MLSLTELLIQRNDPNVLFEALHSGYSCGSVKSGRLGPAVLEPWKEARVRVGLDPTTPKLLSAPKSNTKLNKTGVAYGLTISSHVQTLTSGMRVNVCPNAGHCARPGVCVLKVGNGQYPAVIAGRRARTDFLAENAEPFLYMLGFELGRAVLKHGEILFRPNVNSDIDWGQLVGDGFKYLRGVKSYGYTKRPDVLDRWPDEHPLTVESYSLNENSDLDAVWQFLFNGGSVAAVTNRKEGDPVRQWMTELWPQSFVRFAVVDASVSDAWMFDNGVIGDLAAKGLGIRGLINKNSGFVQKVY